MRKSLTRIALLGTLVLFAIPVWVSRPGVLAGGGGKTPPGGPGLIVFQRRIITSTAQILPIMIMKPDGTGLKTLTIPNNNHGGACDWSPRFADGTLKIGWTDLNTTGERCLAAANLDITGPTLGTISYIPLPLDGLPADGSFASMDWGVPTTLVGGSQTIPVCFTVGGTFAGDYRAFIRVVNLSYTGGVFTVVSFYDLDPGLVGFDYFNARFSPNGLWLALDRLDFASGTQHYAILLVDLTNTWNRSVLIDGPGTLNHSPAWSRDGSRLAFASNRDGRGEDIYVATLNANMSAGPITRLTSSNSSKGAPTWSPDGLQVAYVYDAGRPGFSKIGKTLGNGTEYTLTDGTSPDWSP